MNKPIQRPWLIHINHEWSRPFPLAYGKDIRIRFSKSYSWFSVMIAGDEGECFTKTIFGNVENTIHACVINHIRNPVISFRTEVEESMEIELELKESVPG